VDTTIPVISLNGDDYITHEAGDDYIDANAIWSDIVDGTGVVTKEGDVDTTMPGTYELSFNYTDDAGNKAVTVTRTGQVVDTTAPAIEILGDENVSIYVWTEYSDPGVSAYDIVDGNITDWVERSGELNPNEPGVYEWIYEVEDSHGNAAIAVSRLIEVVNRAPVDLVLSKNRVLENEVSGTVIGIFSAMDPDDENGEKDYHYELLGEGNSSDAHFVLESSGTLLVGDPLDFEQEETHHLVVRVTDEYGASYEEEFTIEVTDVHPPIVDTLSIEELAEGGYWIGGELVDDGGLRSDVHFGVLVSDKPILHRGEEGVADYSLQLDEETLRFSRFYGPEETWRKLYVRAFAVNAEGISYGLEERVRLTPVTKTRDAWSGALPVSGAKGWWQSEWFGVYFKSEKSGWILHSSLGWVYPSPSSGNGLWMWKAGIGWMWTEEGVYPFVYSDASGDWLYFFGEFNQQRLLFDYGQGRWLRLDEVEVDEREESR